MMVAIRLFDSIFTSPFNYCSNNEKAASFLYIETAIKVRDNVLKTANKKDKNKNVLQFYTRVTMNRACIICAHLITQIIIKIFGRLLDYYNNGQLQPNLQFEMHQRMMQFMCFTTTSCVSG